ncbi:MAG TPA: DUF1854 domain-containing protein [Pirellulales bacterium]|nr:DUF1854 domain-containing protein [Pirellulales bacterium]
MQRENMHFDASSDDAFGLHHDALGRLVLTDAHAVEHVDVEPARAFPISDPLNRISIRDNHGRELLWVESLADLPPDVRSVLETDLMRREFIPIVTRIVHMTAFTEPSQWDVETDRGRTQFLLGNEDDIHRLEGHRAIIVDTHGIRFLIPDTRALDAPSRRILERYL